MPQITFIHANGSQKTCSATAGEMVMNVAINNSIDEILAECGGSLSCATCHVYLADEWVSKVPPPNEMEESMLELVDDPAPGSRLSCQIEVTDALDGLTITLPPTSY